MALKYFNYKNMKKFIKILYSIYSILLFLPVRVLAACQSQAGGSGTTPGNGSYQLSNPLCINSLNQLLTDVISIFVKIGSIVVVLFIIYAGLQYVLAQGNPTKIEKAHNTFKYTIIGALIVIGAQVIVDLVTHTVNSL
jgi:hypothetical protein